jgi:hypothetical protein
MKLSPERPPCEWAFDEMSEATRCEEGSYFALVLTEGALVRAGTDLPPIIMNLFSEML